MDEQLQQIKEHWDKTADSAWYQSLRTEEQIQALLKEPAGAFHPAVWQMIRRFLPDFQGKKVLLPSSGDNHAAFALARLGAEIVSADISETQLERAREIAQRHGLPIRFVQDDTARLDKIESGCFDLVYTSNGTVTWIADLEGMCRNVRRVLKPGGFFILYDVHPFQRPFAGEPWKEPKIVKPYGETRPQLHWRVQDLANAMIEGGFSIRRIEELEAVDASFWFPYDQLRRQSPDQLEKINCWKENPMAALPTSARADGHTTRLVARPALGNGASGVGQRRRAYYEAGRASGLGRWRQRLLLQRAEAVEHRGKNNLRAHTSMAG